MNGIPGEDMPAVLHIDIGNRRRKFLKVPIQDSKREINLEKKYVNIYQRQLGHKLSTCRIHNGIDFVIKVDEDFLDFCDQKNGAQFKTNYNK